ncbi:hypothetical protein [Rubrivirga sp.]|uniref:hypothetical protein n=1 Tax=Rubrivirga sp. TaxID=1885344 RepID=UPI003C75CCAA
MSETAPDAEDIPPEDLIGDAEFVHRYMYHGWTSRRPFAQLVLALVWVVIVLAGTVWAHLGIAAWEVSGESEKEFWATDYPLCYPLYKLGAKLLIF